MDDSVSVILPTYNESMNIENMITGLNKNIKNLKVEVRLLLLRKFNYFFNNVLFFDT